ncbi:MAG: hypothetical protein AB7S80_15135 [Rhizobiaceae bacterium]
MRLAIPFAVAATLLLAACSDSTDSQTTGSTTTDGGTITNPEVEKNPRPQTGSGGDQQINETPSSTPAE